MTIGVKTRRRATPNLITLCLSLLSCKNSNNARKSREGAREKPILRYAATLHEHARYYRGNPVALRNLLVIT